VAFDLDPRAPLQASLLDAARIECEQARSALAAPTPAHIHATRKAIKRLRAWLRLLRPQLGHQYRLIDRLLRDSAHQLGGRRDADVALQTLLSLRRARLLDAEQYAQLREMAAQQRHDTRGDAGADARATMLLHAAITYIDTLSLPPIDEATLRAALAKTRQRCRREWKRASAEPAADVLHDWRKWVKHLATQAQLLGGRLGETGLDVGGLKTLGDELGRHHDHEQLLLRLERAGLDRQPLLHLRLRDATLRRQQQLEQRCLRRGRRLLR
jgi:CHAD domain-containing protein